MEKTNDSADKKQNISFISVFSTTFTTVFVAELGDKTQLATLLLSAQSRMPWVVFLGAALALTCSSLVGVLIGQWLSKLLPAEKFEQMAGLLMIFLGLWLGIEASNTLFTAYIP